MSNPLDLIFPKFCLGCAVEGTYLCQRCQNKIITIKYQTCPICKIITPRGAWCTKHHPPTITSEVLTGNTSVHQRTLSGIIAFGYYHDPILREAIHLTKYRRVDELIKTLAQLAAVHFSPLIPHAKVMLMPVPLHPWRQRFRDFNQADLLASQLASDWRLAYLPNHLVRTKHTQPQVDLSNQKRLTNVTDSFAWIGGPLVIKNKTIWLLDDVATTGSTLEACASVLKKHGAKSVWGVVLAKG